MAVTVTPKQCIVRIVCGNGTTAAGGVKTKSINLFSARVMKRSLDQTGLTAAKAVAEALEPILALPTLRVEYDPVSTLESDS